MTPLILHYTRFQLLTHPASIAIVEGGSPSKDQMLDTLQRDLRFAFRQLRQAPGFAATAIVVLALGMCASVAIFTFVDAVLIKPLPYRDPNRLVGVFETNGAMIAQSNLSYPDYL